MSHSWLRFNSIFNLTGFSKREKTGFYMKTPLQNPWKNIVRLFALLSAALWLTLFTTKLTEASDSTLKPQAENRKLVFVQVFDKDKFVDSLTLSDFEIMLNSQPASPQGLALVKGLKVRRTEGREISSPIIPRVFILEFRSYLYDQKFGQMVESLFRRPYSPSDLISLVTPLKPYSFSSQTLRDYLPEELINAGITILKRDLSAAGKTQDELIQDMTALILDLQQSSSPRDVLRQYQQNLDNLRSFRKFSDANLFRAAFQFAGLRAQKHYLLVCQQEFIPIPTNEMIDRLLANQSTMFQARELFRSLSHGQEENLESLIKELTASGLRVDFLYFKTNPRPRPEVQMKEISTDMFDIYSRLARATGGLVESTATPAAQLKKILENSENYYLISFGVEMPEESSRESNIPELIIRIKNLNYSQNYSLKFFLL